MNRDKFLERVKDLTDKIRLGHQAKSFVTENDIGKYLVARAKVDRDSYLLKLADVDPDNPSEIRKYQMAVRVPELLMVWLDEAINDGESSKWELEQLENEGGY